METNQKSKWLCPRCQRWVKEQAAKVCSKCQEEEDSSK